MGHKVGSYPLGVSPLHGDSEFSQKEGICLLLQAQEAEKRFYDGEVYH